MDVPLLMSSVRHDILLDRLLILHDAMRQAFLDRMADSRRADVCDVEREAESDTVYGLDAAADELVLEHLEAFARETGQAVRFLAEGIADRGLIIPAGASSADVVWRILIDPLDGTRELMVQKRPAWILTAVAREVPHGARLQDAVLAVQTEVPLKKQHLADQVWAVRGKGVTARRWSRLDGRSVSLDVRPTRSKTLSHGFAAISRFFPGARDELAALDDELMAAVLGPVEAGRARVFEDQYLSTGGQLYGLMSGQDRFLADLRPLMAPLLARRGEEAGISCHPYDLCTVLIAEELGVVVRHPSGRPLDLPMDCTTPVAWVGYANSAIRDLVEPHLIHILRRRGHLRRS